MSQDSDAAAVNGGTAGQPPLQSNADLEKNSSANEANAPLTRDRPDDSPSTKGTVAQETIEELEKRQRYEHELIQELKSKNQQAKDSPNAVLNQPDQSSSSGVRDLPSGGTFKVSDTPVTFKIPSTIKDWECIILKITGESELWISFVLDGNFVQKMHQKVIRSTSDNAVQTVPVSLSFFKTRPSEISFYASNMVTPIRIMTMVTPDISHLFNDSIKVWCYFVSQLHFTVKVPTGSKTSAANRVQFIVDSNLEEKHLTGEESLDMFINLSEEFPTRTKYDVRASGHLSYGLIKTLSKQNAFFCDKPSCEYRVTIAVNAIDYINFFPSIMESGAKITFLQNMSLLEELEPNEVLKYHLNVDLGESSLLFTLRPMEGSVKLYLAPDEEPKDVEDFMFRASSVRKKQVLVTKKEADALGFQGKGFHVVFANPSSKKAATFKFTGLRFKSDSPVPIKENFSQEGIAVLKEMVNYSLDLRGDVSETVKVAFKLSLKHGVAQLFVKECLPSEGQCVVTFADATQESMSERIFRVSQPDSLIQNDPQNSLFTDLKFNCEGKTVVTSNFDSQRYPLSKTCMFAIGVKALDNWGDVSASYVLTTHGEGSLKDIVPTETALIKLNPKEKARFRLCMADSPGIATKDIFFKMSIISGKFKVYLSKKSLHPNEGDYDQMWSLDNDGFNQVRTKVFKNKFAVNRETPKKGNEVFYVYMMIESDERTVLEMDVRMSEIELSDQEFHRIPNRQIVHSQLSSELPIEPFGKQMAITRPFIYYLTHSKRENEASKIKIGLNSEKVGLSICVKLAKKDMGDISEEDCDYHTLGEHLSIPKSSLAPGITAVMIFVQMIWNPTERALRLPIDFSIKIDDTDQYDMIELIKPGMVYSSKLSPGFSQEFNIDLDNDSSSFALYFASVDHMMICHLTIISRGTSTYLDTIDPSKPIFKISRMPLFKAKYCTAVDCLLMVSVFTPEQQQHRFFITYSFDGQPIVLREGDSLTIENNNPTMFVFESENDVPISFSASSEFTELVVSARRVNESESMPKANAWDKTLAMPFDFKSNVERNPHLTIPMSFLTKGVREKFLFLVRPVMSEVPSTEAFHVVFERNTMSVHLHARVLRLVPFTQTSASASKKDFLNFYFNLDEPSDFSVALSVISGEAIMYLSKEAGSPPTKKRFWKKTTSSKGDEIVVTKDQLVNDNDYADQIYVGVFCIENCSFKLLFMPDFKNLVKVKFQELSELDLVKDRKFYFSYANVKSAYDTLLYSEGSDIEVSVLNYEDVVSNFIQMISVEENFTERFVFKRGDLPRKRHFDGVAPIDSHTIVRIKPLNADCRIFFAIYNKEKPIEVRSESTVSFTQNENEKNTFMTKLGNNYDEIEVHVKLEFGSVSVRYGNNLANMSSAQKVTTPGQKVFDFKVTNTVRSNDLVIFNHFLVEVESSEFSRFTLMLKPKHKFKEIKPFEQEIVHPSKNKDLYLYFTLTSKSLRTVKSISIDFTSAASFKERPELLFISNSDVTLNEDSPFMPMPINDLFERTKNDFYHLEIKPEPQSGSYVLKVLKSDSNNPIKISLSFNDQRTLSPNGLYHGSIPVMQGRTHEYSIFLPQKGEFRMVLESCSAVQIDQAKFFGEDSTVIDKRDHNMYFFDPLTNITTIDFNKQYRQYAMYAQAVHSVFETSEEIQIFLMNIKRGFVSSPGLLKFNVTLKEGREKYDEKASKSYVLMTEFRPSTKELMMKDYIVQPQADQLDKYLPTIKFDSGNMLVRIRTPKFTPQLLVDYPHIKSVVIKFHLHLFSNDDFKNQFSDCGFDFFNTVQHSIVLHSVELTRTAIEDTKGEMFNDVMVDSARLKMFSDSPTLDLFCSVSVHFYNNEDEKHQIGVNVKYAQIPYFSVKLSNQSRSFFSAHWGLGVLLAVAIVFLFLVFVCIMRSSGEKGRRSDKGYSRPKEQVEMSAISSN